ncbi:coenzyme A biosynthesis bifunctional protein CoaBC [Spirochaetota bacterium]|nr:coenzyme A biosynthesis bifunctional protein CoaBC [Spirochaetota bacterium]
MNPKSKIPSSQYTASVTTGTNDTNDTDSSLELTDDRAVIVKEELLLGKKIALAIGGGIAATQSIKLIRTLRRYGAEVQVYAGSKALKFITPLSLEWASARPIISASTGAAEHLFTADLLIVAPATLNILSKAALGIADSLITTLIASALGRSSEQPLAPSLTQEPHSQLHLTTRRKSIHSPLLLVPSMHLSLANNPFLATHLATLTQHQATILKPHFIEGKAKSPSPSAITLAAIRSLTSQTTSRVYRKKIFITAGAVPTYIDNVRMISNIATGTTGIALATYAHALGATVTLLIKKGAQFDATTTDLATATPLPYQTVFFQDYDDYSKKVLELIATVRPDSAIFTAAVSDYRVTPFTPGKIPSQSLTQLNLTTTSKVINEVKAQYPKLDITAFKLEAAQSEEQLLNKGKAYLKARSYNRVVLNRLATTSSTTDNNKKSLTGSPPITITTNPSPKLTRYILEYRDREMIHTVAADNFQLAKQLFT